MTQRGLKPAALAALCLPPALLAWRLARFPGWELTDESFTLSLWQRWHEGLGQSWYVTRGCLHRALVEGFLVLGGWRYEAVWSASLSVYGAFLAALHSAARRHLGSEAAWGALIVAGAAALPAVQLGSLLSPQLQPLLWSAAAWAALELREPWQAACWGLACGVALLDYEAWMVALPGLFLLLALRPAPARRVAAAAAGLAAAALALLWHSAPMLADYLRGRRAYSGPGSGGHAAANLVRHLAEFFLGGGNALPTQGVPGGAAQFPLWALPLLAAAAWSTWRRRDGSRRLRAALWICAALPFSVFILYAPAVPSQRVLAAWPALCLLAGDSLAGLWGRSRPWALALAVWIALGAAVEARAYTKGFEAQGTRFYGGGGALLAAARSLHAAGDPEFLYELDAAPRGDVRLAQGALGPGNPARGTVALIPWQCEPALAAGKGRWEPFDAGADQPPRSLYWVPPSDAAPLREAHARLKAFWDAERDRFNGTVYKDLVAATREPIPNPWVRDALWEARFLYARRVGRPEASEGERALALGMLRVDPLLREARDGMLRQPAQAERLLRVALRRDPRRREAWGLLRQLLARAGRNREVAQLDDQYAHLAGPTYAPFWLAE